MTLAAHAPMRRTVRKFTSGVDSSSDMLRVVLDSTAPENYGWMVFDVSQTFLELPLMSKTCIGARFPAKAGRHLVFTLFFSRKVFVESAVFINFGRHYASVFMSVVSFGFCHSFPRGRDGFHRCV